MGDRHGTLETGRGGRHATKFPSWNETGVVTEYTEEIHQNTP